MSNNDHTPPPVASGTVLFRDSAGNLHVTVIVKATYALKPGGLAVPAPPLPLTEDTPRDGAPANSLYAASDFAPCKLRADVVVVGRVHPVSLTTVRQVVGFALARGPDVLLTKRLVAIGDRARPDAEPSKLTEMPLCWERTWGGPSCQDNPVGSGLSDSTPRAPNLVDPDAPRRLSDSARSQHPGLGARSSSPGNTRPRSKVSRSRWPTISIYAFSRSRRRISNCPASSAANRSS